MGWNYDLPFSNYFISSATNPQVTNTGDCGWGCTYVSGPLIGTTGQCRELQAVNIENNIVLTNRGYHAIYRMYVPSHGGWLPWVSSQTQFRYNNDNSYAGVLGKRAEAIQFKVIDSAGREVTQNCTIAYRAHMQNRGWLSWVFTARQHASDSEIRDILIRTYGENTSHDLYSTDAGLPGSGLRLEAIEVMIFAK